MLTKEEASELISKQKRVLEAARKFQFAEADFNRAQIDLSDYLSKLQQPDNSVPKVKVIGTDLPTQGKSDYHPEGYIAEGKPVMDDTNPNYVPGRTGL